VDVVAVEVLGRDLFDSLFDVLSRQTECLDPTCALNVNCCNRISMALYLRPYLNILP
jgi:hypothetical protein